MCKMGQFINFYNWLKKNLFNFLECFLYFIYIVGLFNIWFLCYYLLLAFKDIIYKFKTLILELKVFNYKLLCPFLVINKDHPSFINFLLEEVFTCKFNTFFLISIIALQIIGEIEKKNILQYADLYFECWDDDLDYQIVNPYVQIPSDSITWVMDRYVEMSLVNSSPEIVAEFFEKFKYYPFEFPEAPYRAQLKAIEDFHLDRLSSIEQSIFFPGSWVEMWEVQTKGLSYYRFYEMSPSFYKWLFLTNLREGAPIPKYLMCTLGLIFSFFIVYLLYLLFNWSVKNITRELLRQFVAIILLSIWALGFCEDVFHIINSFIWD